MDTLLELLPRIRDLGDREAVRFSNGLRTWRQSWNDVYARIGAIGGFLDSRGLGRGDRLILWSENRIEWIAAFWAALGRGIQLVPLDAQTPPDRVARIQDQVAARLLVTDQPSTLPIDTLRTDDIPGLPFANPVSGTGIGPDDIVEIVYTSGTTGDPKGVIHRHRNITANLTPIAREIDRYRLWARPFQPIRILDLLPFSHMFGQAIGVFIPPVLGGSVVLTTERHPGAILRRIAAERVSVLASVPRQLTSLEAEIRRRHPDCEPAGDRRRSVPGRWWRHRGVHRDFGWKFWAFVVGGAELPRASEEFWTSLGFAVVQGYGLTETSPVVSVNHPLHPQPGTLGRALGDQEVRIAEDGEILVRGPAIVSEYLSAQGRTPAIDPDGWLHTGDVGAIDTEGRLIFRGRKKDVIVLADGFNVYPEDVERVLNAVAGVRDSAVVPVRMGEEERTHAALILEDDTISAETIVEEANRRLEPQQRIRSWSVWPDADFPRTLSTMKVQRRKVAEQVGQHAAPPEPGGGHDTLSGLIAEVSPGVSPGDMSSLERVDLQALIEDRFRVELDEVEFSRISTLPELESYVDRRRRARVASPTRTAEAAAGRAAAEGTASTLRPPRWTRLAPVLLFRRLFQAVVIRPLLRVFVRVDATGLENLPLPGTGILFAATHQSHFDVPVILRALPPGWRSRVAPAMMQEHFLTGGQWVSRGRQLEYCLALAVFNAYPLPQRPGQIRDSLEYTGELVSTGYAPLVFPEGLRSADGRLQPFRAGIAFMSIQLGVPVVPVRILGLFEVLPVGARWPRRGRVRVVVGAPMVPLDGESYTEFAARIEAAIRALS